MEDLESSLLLSEKSESEVDGNIFTKGLQRRKLAMQDRKKFLEFVAEKQKEAAENENKKAEKKKQSCERRKTRRKTKKVNSSSDDSDSNAGEILPSKTRDVCETAEDDSTDSSLPSDVLEDILVSDDNDISPPKKSRSRNCSKRRPKQVIRDLNHESFEISDDDLEVLNDDVTPQNISINICCRGKSIVQTVKIAENFKELFQTIALKYDINVAQVILYYKDSPIDVSDSPKSLGMSEFDTIDAIITLSNKVVINQNCIQIKIQTKNAKEKTIIPVHKLEKFSIMMQKYSEQVNIPLKQLTFEFDGEELLAEQTPEELEMEDESVIDVKINSAV